MNDLSLLCETCGYPIQGLPRDTVPALVASPVASLVASHPHAERMAPNVSAESLAPARPPQCPECGTPIADSLPERRTGSPWQRRPGLASWVRTMHAMVRHPTTTFGDMIIRKGARSLLALNLLLVSLLVAPPMIGVLTIDLFRAWRGRGPVMESLAWVVSLLGVTMVIFAFFAALTLVEFVGIRFFARRRRFRLSRDAAAQVCAHASVGWLASGTLPYLLAPAAIMLVQALGIAQKPIDFSPYLLFNMPVSAAASILGYAAGLIGGMIAFEWLVYFGVRRNRFANHATSSSVAGAPQLTSVSANSAAS